MSVSGMSAQEATEQAGPSAIASPIPPSADTVTPPEEQVKVTLADIRRTLRRLRPFLIGGATLLVAIAIVLASLPARVQSVDRAPRGGGVRCQCQV